MSVVEEYDNCDAFPPWRRSVREVLYPLTSGNVLKRPKFGRGWYENLILCTLVFNMIISMLIDTSDRSCTQSRNRTIKILDMICTSIYCTEILARGIGFGFHIYASLDRGGDALIIFANLTLGILFYQGVPNTNFSLTVLRCPRLLRPFFTTLRWRSVRVLLVSLVKSLYQLADVMLLYFLFLLWFSVAAVYQFGGVMRTRCVSNDFMLYGNDSTLAASPSLNVYSTLRQRSVAFDFLGDNATAEAFVCGGEYDQLLRLVDAGILLRMTASNGSSSYAPVEMRYPSVNLTSTYLPAPNISDDVRIDVAGFNTFPQFCSPHQTCDVHNHPVLKGYKCPFGYHCTHLDNPYRGQVGFDDLGQAILSLYTSVTFQLWYEVMFWTLDATNFSAYAFFVVLVVVGAYLIINLTIVIITVEYEKGKESERRRIQELISMQEKEGKLSSLASVVNQLVINQRQQELRGLELHRPDQENGGRNENEANSNDANSSSNVDGFDGSSSSGTSSGSGGSDSGDDSLGSGPCSEESNRSEGGEDASPRSASSEEGQQGSERKRRSGRRRRSSLHDSSAAALLLPPSDDASATASSSSSPLNTNIATATANSKTQQHRTGRRSSRTAAHYSSPLTDPLLFDQPGVEGDQNNVDGTRATAEEERNKKNRKKMKRRDTTVKNTGFRQRVRRFMRKKVVRSLVFNYVTIALITANIVILAAEHYGMSDELRDVFDTLNYIFTGYFTFEAFCIFLSSSMKEYFGDFHNMIDLVVVLVSWVDIAMTGMNFPVIRAMRIFRAIKLLKPFPTLYHWILFIVAATKTSPIVLLLLGMLVFVFSCIAMQAFGGLFCGIDPSQKAFDHYCAGIPRGNFETFGHAIRSSIQILTADDWNYIMYDATLSKGTLWWSLPFVAFFYMGNYIVLNLLIAVLLSASADRTEALEEAEEKMQIEEARRNAVIEAVEGGAGGGSVALGEEQRNAQAVAGDGSGTSATGTGKAAGAKGSAADFSAEVTQGSDVVEEEADGPRADRIDDFAAQMFGRSERGRKFDYARIHFQHVIEHKATQISISIVIILGSVCNGLENPIAAPDQWQVKVLGYIDIACTCVYVVETLVNCFAYGVVKGNNSYLRRDHWNKFDFVLVVISVVGVAVQNVSGKQNSFVWNLVVLRGLRPLRLVRHSPGMKLVLSSLFASISELRNVFLISATILLMGGVIGVFLFAGKFRMCRFGTVFVDTLIRDECVSTAIGGITGEWKNPEDGIHFDHIGAALMAMFQMSTLEGWNTIMYRVADTTQVGHPPRRDNNPWGTVYVIFFTMFTGFFLANLFISVLIDSYNKQKRTKSLARSIFITREQEGWMITNKRLFRQLPHEIQQRLSSEEVDKTQDDAEDDLLGSPSQKIPLIGVTQEDDSGNDRHEEEMTAIVPGAAATATAATTTAPHERPKEKKNMLVAAAMSAKKRTGKAATFVKQQTERTVDFAIEQTSILTFRDQARSIVRHIYFRNAIFVIIFANFIAMSVEHYPQPPAFGETLEIINIVFIILFALEAILKIYAESWKIYIGSKWNKLDFFVVLVSIIGLAASSSRSSALVRSVRIVRLAKAARGTRFQLDILIRKFGRALGALINVGAVIFLVFAVFAVFGIKMFGRVKHGVFGVTMGIDRHTNFAHIGNALILLLRVMTGGNWVDIMTSCRAKAPFCDKNIGECGSTGLSYFYFVLFNIASLFILRNLITAVLLDSFLSSGQNRAITQQQSVEIYEAWKKFDPMCTMRISAWSTIRFVRKIPPECILSFNSKPTRQRISLEMRWLKRLQITNPNLHVASVSFETITDTLCSFAYNIRPPAGRGFVAELQPNFSLDEVAKASCEAAAKVMFSNVIWRQIEQRRRRKRRLLKQQQQQQAEEAGGVNARRGSASGRGFTLGKLSLASTVLTSSATATATRQENVYLPPPRRQHILAGMFGTPGFEDFEASSSSEDENTGGVRAKSKAKATEVDDIVPRHDFDDI